MAFTMAHLYIAKNIYEKIPDIIKIKDLSQFYLGTIAPDAVHNRADYISDYKRASHLCVGDEPWGMVTNNDEWIANVLNFFCKNKNSDNFDFISGYCVHILTDIYNNIAVWIPFKQKYQYKPGKGYGNLYHQESETVDIELALKHENKKDFWIYLEKAKPINLDNLDNIIFADDIEKQKENILYYWYKNQKHQDIASNKIITIESNIKFVKDATVFVADKLISL